MQTDNNTLGLVHNYCLSSNHSSCKKSVNNWISSAKIMLNVDTLFGINNLWKTGSSRKHGMNLRISLFICVLALIAYSDAYPAPSAARDQSRQYSNFLTSNVGNLPASQRSFNDDSSSSGDATLSLSIFSPLDILRQNMLLEIQRKRIRHAKQRQMQTNKEYLDRIG